MVEKYIHNVLRKRNEEKFDYTWAKKQKKKRTIACLDFRLASNNILNKFLKIDIGNPSNISEHRTLMFTIACSSMTTCPRFWCFNKKNFCMI